MVIIFLVVLICAGCTGDASTPDNNTGAEPGQPAVNQAQPQAPNEDTSANQPAADSGVNLDPGQPVSHADPNAGTSAGPGAGENDNPGTAAANGVEKSPGLSAPKVSLWVTRDFAQSQLYGSEVAFNPGDSVMDILKKHLDVKTEYGGGFVESINGLSSGYTGADKKTRDWFYYANGIITSVGALDYKPTPGDVIWWDYHDWGGAVFTPALIGAFPEPFVSGYRGQKPGTIVLTAPGCEQQGRQMVDYLHNLGAEKVTVQPYEEKIVTASDKITLVVGLWDQFAGERFWQGMQKQRKKTGLFFELTPDYFATLDMNGEIVAKYNQQVGAITATGSGMGDPTPVWLVTGLDQAGLDEAVSVFTTKPVSFKQYFGALITGGEVLPVPAK